MSFSFIQLQFAFLLEWQTFTSLGVGEIKEKGFATNSFEQLLLFFALFLHSTLVLIRSFSVGVNADNAWARRIQFRRDVKMGERVNPTKYSGRKSK